MVITKNLFMIQFFMLRFEWALLPERDCQRNNKKVKQNYENNNN